MNRARVAVRLASLVWSLAAAMACASAGRASEPDTLSSAGAPPAPVVAADRARPDAEGAAAAHPRSHRLVQTTFLTRSSATPLAEPSGVVADAFGRIWMSDAALHKLVRYGAAGERLDETGALGSEPGQFRQPGALARVGSLGVAVLDIENRRVTVYDHHLRAIGTAIDLAAPELEARIGRVTPVGLTADRGGALYVADAERDRILVFDFGGAYQREIGGFGARSGAFSGLLAIAAGARGTLITVERPRGRAKRTSADSLAGRSRVQWLDAGGRVVNSVWLPVWPAGAAESGVALAVSDSGQVAVTGERSGELFVLAPDGLVLAQASGLGAPRAVAFDDAGELFVAATLEARLLRFTLVPLPED